MVLRTEFSGKEGGTREPGPAGGGFNSEWQRVGDKAKSAQGTARAWSWPEASRPHTDVTRMAQMGRGCQQWCPTGCPELQAAALTPFGKGPVTRQQEE